MKQDVISEKLGRLDERLKEIKDGDNGDLPSLIKKVDRINGAVRSNTIWRTVTVSFGGAWLVILTGMIVYLLTNNPQILSKIWHAFCGG